MSRGPSTFCWSPGRPRGWMLTISQLWNTVYCGFFWFGLFFFSLKICTSQVMGIGLCSPQLAAPSGWQLTACVLLWLQSPVCSYCGVKSTRGVLSWWKRELWVPQGSGQCQQHVAQIVTVSLLPEHRGPFPFPLPYLTGLLS